MEELRELKQFGESLGFQGEELQSFIRDQQDRQREERQVQREEARRTIEREQLKMEQEAKLKLEQDLRDSELSRREHDLKEKLQLLQIEHAQKMEAMEAQFRFRQPVSESAVKVQLPKLQPFDDKDDIDAYLRRFERHVIAKNMEESLWAVHLGSLLKGKALDVYSRLSSEEANDYKVLKSALLKRFEMTEEGFMKRFHSAIPEYGETFSQFMIRLANYLDRWIELSGIKKDYEGLFDLTMRHQFLSQCSRELSLFLRERIPENIRDMGKLADQFCEARNGKAVHFVKKVSEIKRNVDKQPKLSPHESTPSTEKQQSIEDKTIRKPYDKSCVICYRCREPGHKSNECPRKNYVSSVTIGSNTTVGCNLPIGVGKVNGHMVTILRDTGCSGIVVRRELVTDRQWTNQIQTIHLIDGTSITAPIVNIFIDTPYYTGNVEAWCLDNPLYDLIIGNVEGVRGAESLNKDWKPICVAETRSKKWGSSKGQLQVPSCLNLSATPNDLRISQQEDSTLGKLKIFAQNDHVKTTVKGCSSAVFYKNGLLYRKYTNANKQTFTQLIVPEKYRNSVMKLAHETVMAGHLAAKKTTDRVLAEFYWPAVHSDIVRFCRSCDVCQKTVSKGKMFKAPLGRMPLIDEPFKRIAVDLIGPISPVSNRGFRYILTVVDYATRYPEAIPLKKIDTENVAEALIDIYSRVGFPSEMLSYRGSQFMSELMCEISRLLSVKQLATTPYHPMCNGLVEKFNGTLKQMLKRMCEKKSKRLG